ncbi:MAG: four helix bundle protein [Muribaculaceae bacterium]|nr:four helix bundle protein [Muribaculaceae bacterium]
MLIKENGKIKYIKDKDDEPVKVIDLITEIYNLIKLLSENDINEEYFWIKQSLMIVIFNISYYETTNSRHRAISFLDIAKVSLNDIERKLLDCERFEYISNEYTYIIRDRIRTIEKMIDNLKKQRIIK